MNQPVEGQETKWIQLPPRGDPVDVYLVLEGKDGQLVERAISDFVTRSNTRAVASNEGGGASDAGDEIEFPKTFLFAGSHLHGNGPGPRTYLADRSGNVISIATFGDELLCLPGMHAKANDALMWQVAAKTLPPIGSKVTLRLRPRDKSAQPAARTDRAQQRPPKADSQQDQS